MLFMQPNLVLILKFPPEHSSPMPSNQLQNAVFQNQNSAQFVNMFLQLHASKIPHSARLLYFSVLYLVSGLLFLEGRVGALWVVSEQ
jgi:hypothetical protein